MKKLRQTKRRVLSCFESPIIGGKYKGKKILIPNLSTTRSSKAILRESLFNTLQFDIIDKNFVEVFAGSGSIGLEALSRGAKEVFFIEKERAVHSILKENIGRVGTGSATAILGDSFEEFQNVYNSNRKTETKTYFYFDPPFSTREGMVDIYGKMVTLMEMIEPSVCEMVIVEHMSSVYIADTIGALDLKKRKRFGKSTLSYYIPLQRS